MPDATATKNRWGRKGHSVPGVEVMLSEVNGPLLSSPGS